MKRMAVVPRAKKVFQETHDAQKTPVSIGRHRVDGEAPLPAQPELVVAHALSPSQPTAASGHRRTSVERLERR